MDVSIKSRKPRKNNRKRSKKSVKPSKSFVKKVKAVFASQVESKQAYRNESVANINATITTAADAFQLLPNVTNGVTDHHRIGDQVRAQRLTIKGHIVSNLTLTGITQSRLAMRMMIVVPKQYSNFAQIQANAVTWLPLLLKKGATVTAFTGIISDLYAPINTDAITCYYDKVTYIQSPYVATAVGDISVHNSTKFFSKTLKIKNKLLKYDSNIDAGLTPSNYNPVLLLGYVKLDGTAPDANNQLNLSYTATLDYEDA